jgi:hypothetical protein
LGKALQDLFWNSNLAIYISSECSTNFYLLLPKTGSEMIKNWMFIGAGIIKIIPSSENLSLE